MTPLCANCSNCICAHRKLWGGPTSSNWSEQTFHAFYTCFSQQSWYNLREVRGGWGHRKNMTRKTVRVNMFLCDVLWTMYVCIVLCHIWSWLPNWFLTLRLSSFFITSMTKKCQTLKLHRSEELRVSEVKIKVLHRLVEEQLTQCLSSEEWCISHTT